MGTGQADVAAVVFIWPDEPEAQQPGTLVCCLGVAMDSNVLFQDVVLINGRELAVIR